VPDRVINFAAGPSTLPLPVLERVRDEIVSLPGVGASALEVSHRGAWFTDVIAEAESNLRSLLAIPDSHRVVFCQGGATLQFSMVAMNFLRGTHEQADYVVTGSWGKKAVTEAEKEGRARIAWSGDERRYAAVPSDEDLTKVLSGDAAYAHVTTNETIQGVEYPGTPTMPAGVPLIADGSSDFLSRPVDLADYGVLYAGAQKNAGPAGVTVAIVRRDLLSRIPDGLPTMLDYRTYVDSGSLHNTPPVFAIYVLLLVTRWLRDDVGGLDAMHARNREKAALLYSAIDDMADYYRGHAERSSRSLMNVTFRLPSEALERTFASQAADAGMVELKGHRSVGGIRASIYNAMPLEGVHTLERFMRRFRADNPAQ
jgi:phosphoserine aminotransferase